MDWFDRILAILAAVFIVSSAVTVYWFHHTDTSQNLDDFELNTDTTFRFSYENYQSITNNTAGKSEDYVSGLEYYTVTNVAGSTVEYTHTIAVNGHMQSSNMSCDRSEFLTFDEEYYKTLINYKSETVSQSPAKVPYKQQINATRYHFLYEKEDQNTGYTYEATFDVYVAKGYLISYGWNLIEETSTTKTIQTEKCVLDDLIIKEKSMKNSSPSSKIASFTLETGCTIDRAVKNTVGSSIEDKGAVTNSSEIYNFQNVIDTNVDYEVTQIAADGTTTVTDHSTTISAFWNKDIRQWVNGGYNLEKVCFKELELTTLGKLFTIQYSLSYVTLTETTEVVFTLYNGIVITSSTKVIQTDGSWTETYWEMK